MIAHLVSLLDRAAGSLGRARLTPVAQRPIFTPDRRLRVFVSSTLRELALERMGASEAISSLHLAPVLFEQGARPHAPRDLYAAYVRQCEVFAVELVAVIRNMTLRLVGERIYHSNYRPLREPP